MKARKGKYNAIHDTIKAGENHRRQDRALSRFQSPRNKSKHTASQLDRSMKATFERYMVSEQHGRTIRLPIMELKQNDAPESDILTWACYNSNS